MLVSTTAEEGMATTGEGAAGTVEDGGGRNAVSSWWISQGSGWVDEVLGRAGRGELPDMAWACK